MNGKTNHTMLVIVGLVVLFIAADFGSPGYAAHLDRTQPKALPASILLVPAAQAAQPTASPVGVSSQGGGVVGVLPAEGAGPPTPLPVTVPTSGVLPETGRSIDTSLYFVLGAVSLLGAALIALGLSLRSSRRRDPIG